MRKLNIHRSTKSLAVGSRPAHATLSKIILPAAGEVSHIKSKWSWHYRTLLRLREQLWQERDEQLRHAAQPLESHGIHAADTASDEFEHALALSRISAEQDALYEIEEAIHRILNGSYGVCQSTGQPILAARLRAIPWTRFSKSAEAAQERAGQINSHPALGKLTLISGIRPTASLEMMAAEEAETPAPVPVDETFQSKTAAVGPEKSASHQTRMNRKSNKTTL
jgi:RNA polymerase-binding transcription factor DksA